MAPVLPAVPWVLPGRLLDVGSGNGSPGLVLALLAEGGEVVLLEPRARRWAFLREAARAAGVADRVKVRRERHDAYRGAPARTLVLRALALPLAELAPLVDPGGRVLVFGGRPRREGPFDEEPLPGAPQDLHAFRRR